MRQDYSVYPSMIGAKSGLICEWNKWTAISQQRIISIDNQKINHIAIITVQGVPGETISMVVFHSILQSVTVNCKIPADIGSVRIIITISSVSCT
jgi:hypothetical protein